MTEPDVTLTDYALMILCVAFVRKIAGQSFKMPILQKLWCVFFGSVALASLMGGTVHGFYLNESSLGFQILWPITLLAVGVTAGTAWVLSGLFAFGQGALKSSLIFSGVIFLVYSAIVLVFSQSFVVVIINYLPPMVIFFVLSVKEYIRTRLPAFLWLAGGIGISFIGAYIQQVQIALHPEYFNHNSTYHLLQAFSLSALFYGAKRIETIKGTL